MESHRFTLAEDLALVLEPVEEQLCPLKNLTTWCHHKQVGHRHGVKGSPCLWDGGVPPHFTVLSKIFLSLSESYFFPGISVDDAYIRPTTHKSRPSFEPKYARRCVHHVEVCRIRVLLLNACNF